MVLKSKKKFGFATLVLFCLLGLVITTGEWHHEALAKPPLDERQNLAKSYGRVVYDPSSGSYFEVVPSKAAFQVWRNEQKAARKRIYKGIRGRLAVIKSRKTHDFLKYTLGIPREAWIGLRYHCSSGKLVWNTGEVLRKGVDFENWHPYQIYYEKKNYCLWGEKHLVAFLTGLHVIYEQGVTYDLTGKRLYWRLSGPEHAIHYALIEYPTR